MQDTSPDTAPWRAVWAAYDDPTSDPIITWNLIVTAAGSRYTEGLTDSSVRHLLEDLLDAPMDISDPFSSKSLERLAAMREGSIRHLVAEGTITFYTGFAELAMHRAVLRGALACAAPERARLFLSEITAAAAEYLIGRDQVRLITPGHGLTHMSARKAAIVEASRARALGITFGFEPIEEWSAAVRTIWSAG